MWGLSYWVFPVISGVVWVAMLMGMLIDWCADGRPHLRSMSDGQWMAYISNIGADKLKPLFIAGSVITTIFLDLAFVSERWLRHRGRLARNLSLTEKVLSGLSMVFALVGTCGLILLSIFDTYHYPTVHDICLLLFMAGYIISAIFICAEYQRLGIHFRQHRILRISFWIKLTFILLNIGLAIGFGYCNFRNRLNDAAIIEWTIAFFFTFYILSYFMDLIPAVHTKHVHDDTTELETEQNDPAARRTEMSHNY